MTSLSTRPPFEIWAPQEVNRLRREADALEGALNVYLARSGNALGANGASAQSSTLLGTRPREGGRRSRYEPAFEQFALTGRPLSLDEMLEIARSKGFNLSRNNMRSIVFAQKKAGRARADGDKYAWGKFGEVWTSDLLGWRPAAAPLGPAPDYVKQMVGNRSLGELPDEYKDGDP